MSVLMHILPGALLGALIGHIIVRLWLARVDKPTSEDKWITFTRLRLTPSAGPLPEQISAEIAGEGRSRAPCTIAQHYPDSFGEIRPGTWHAETTGANANVDMGAIVRATDPEPIIVPLSPEKQRALDEEDITREIALWAVARWEAAARKAQNTP